MKLLLYSHFFAPSIGGVETSVQLLATGLSARRTASGQPEFVVTLATQTPSNDLDDAAFPFRVVRQPGLAQLWRLIREADVVHLAGPALLPLALGRALRKRVVVEHHGYQAICPNGLLLMEPALSVCPGHFQAMRYGECARCNPAGSLRWRNLKGVVLTFIRRALCRRVAANLAISNHVLRRHGLPRSSTLYYGIEDPLPRPLAETTGVRRQTPVCFAYVGRLVPEKGPMFLLQAAGRLRKEDLTFELHVIGDGPQRAEIEEYIRREDLEGCVHITGFLTGAAFQEALHGVDVVVMPSVCEETAGLAAIEQMMREKLVIASAIGGLGEVVGDAGLACLPGDADALANCMRRVLADPSLIGSIGVAARARALQLFARQRMIEEHAAVYGFIQTGQSGDETRS